MRVVRVGGRYLEGREQRLWLALASVIGLSGAGIGLVAQGPPLQWAGVTAVLAGLPLSVKISHRLTSVCKGRLGERLVTNLLRRLPDDYWLVNDIVLGRTRGNVDHVLIGPCGVVVIETKRLAGRIRCWGDEWSVNGHPRGSISRQVNSGACAVRYFLVERHPDLASTALRWVESIVVFTHPLCRLEVNHARATVVRYSELLQVVLKLAKKHRMAPATAARLAESLAASQTAPVVESGARR
jgi:hypothetical protein